MVGCVNLVVRSTTPATNCLVFIAECVSTTGLEPYLDSMSTLEYIEQHDDICPFVNCYFIARL